MYSLISQSGRSAYGVKEYVCDTVADFNRLPANKKAGSTAFIIETGALYILNSDGEWKDFNGNDNIIIELEAQIENLTKENKTLTATNEALTAENETLKVNNQILQEQNDYLQKDNTVLNETIATLETKILELEKKIEELTPDVEIAGSTILIPKDIGFINQETNTLILTNENSEVIGNTLILK